MKKFFYKIIRGVYLFWVGLFYGMRAVDNEIFTIETSDTEIGSNVDAHANGVAGAMLRGEVTQQVKELRYRTYKVDRESKKYQYYSPTLALRREKFDSKFATCENLDGLEIVVIQPNDIYHVTAMESLANADINNTEEIGSTVNGQGEKDIAVRVTYSASELDKPKNVINIERSDNFIPRYKLEDYTKRVVVRRKKDKECIVDFYVSMYPDISKFKSKGFVSEIKKLKDLSRRNDISDIQKLKFVSYKAFGVEDLTEFEFNLNKFIGVFEFDGMYILRYEATSITEIDLVMTKYFNPEMEAKYAKKEKKDIVLNIFGSDEKREYVCAKCGKVIKYDTEHIDSVMPSKGRDIDDEVEDNNDAIEFMDAQIAYQTFGCYLCKDCLTNYMKNMPR